MMSPTVKVKHVMMFGVETSAMLSGLINIMKNAVKQLKA